MILLSWVDLTLAGSLVVLLALINWFQGLGLGRKILLGAARAVVQLTLVGLVLKSIFAWNDPWAVGSVALVMLLFAGREVQARQTRPFEGLSGYWAGTSAMFVSSFGVGFFALLVVLGNHPWYQPQYAIPLLGMLLGNCMTGVALGLNQFSQGIHRDQAAIEAKLTLGWTGWAASGEHRRQALQMALTPILNAMASAGLVSIPGMMTGQILAGGPPMEAAKYQILILFMIAAGTGFGVLLAVSWAAYRLFDERHRLRLDRLRAVFVPKGKRI